MLNLNNKKELILEVLNSYENLTIEQLESLINNTNLNGVSFVSVKGYSSEKSNNTEVANQVINIGASYKNMLKKDTNIYANFDLSSVDVDAFNYDTINTNGLTLNEYKKAVKDSLEIALNELSQPKKKKVSNDIYFNNALAFNTNTRKLSLLGQTINKTIEKKGTFKVVKSAPKTIAKKLIERKAKGKTQTLRRFAIDNLAGSVKVSGETIEIG